MSWRLGISTGACTDRPIVDVLPAIHAAGARAVEVGTPPRHFDPWSDAQVRDLDQRLREVTLEAVSIHTPFGGSLELGDADPGRRRAAIDAALTAGRALKRLGGRLVVVHPTDLPRHEHDAHARLVEATRSLAALAEECAHADLTLVVESPLPHLIGGHPDEFAFLLDRLPDSVGVCLDTGHTFLGGHWRRFVDVAGARLMHVHANDNRGTWDDHLPPGDGLIDWGEIAHSLRTRNFSGWVMLELACPGAQPLDDHLRRAFERAQVLFQ
ncbi:MAG TPA: sugar phosphate isomerase/epimerase family protein [Vicinamibacterales bacterium]|nr:sugar phosphate isomerase/epimerase family protein [Vicinamibacterales bacterium]